MSPMGTARVGSALSAAGCTTKLVASPEAPPFSDFGQGGYLTVKGRHIGDSVGGWCEHTRLSLGRLVVLSGAQWRSVVRPLCLGVPEPPRADGRGLRRRRGRG